MRKGISVLVVGDQEYALSIGREMKRAGYAPRCWWVTEKKRFSGVLRARTCDVIIADCLPFCFSARAALELLRGSKLDIPCIVVADEINEATTVELIKAGARDCISKKNIARLVPALEREINEVSARRKQKDAEQERILAAIEQEQNRIGRDLHDGLGQTLTAIKFRAGLLQQKLSRKRLSESADAETLEWLVNDAIAQAQGMARGLNPVKFTHGLSPALEELAASTEQTFALHCGCKFRETVPLRDQGMANHLYRIAQEAIQNAIKHGKAKNIRIELKELGKNLALRVEDDGIGFPTNHPNGGKGMGLINMAARAHLIGARLDVRPRRHGGTVVTCRGRVAERSV